jgi:nicotinamide mononucleotide adenylyltransferase
VAIDRETIVVFGARKVTETGRAVNPIGVRSVGYVIFAARFQPLHNGHVAALLEYKALGKLNDALVLAVVSSSPAVGTPDRDFVAAASEDFSVDRNPWSVSQRLRAVTAVNETYLGGTAVVTAIPRPDLGWPIIELWFPSPRTWIIRRAGINDSFDDAKERFRAARGDEVLRVRDRTGISGREARELFARGAFEELRTMMPPAVHAAYDLASS